MRLHWLFERIVRLILCWCLEANRRVTLVQMKGFQRGRSKLDLIVYSMPAYMFLNLFVSRMHNSILALNS